MNATSMPGRELSKRHSIVFINQKNVEYSNYDLGKKIIDVFRNMNNRSAKKENSKVSIIAFL